MRHPPRSRPVEGASAGVNMDRIAAHIAKYIGEPQHVFHELESDLVHLDVHVVPPAGGREYWTLVTSGMSDRPMAVPSGLEDQRYAELMICLLKEWALPWDKQDWAGTPEEAYWPVYWLKTLARLPHELQTWLGYGHTIPNGDPPEPYARNTKLCCALLVNPTIASAGFSELSISPEQTIHFYAVVPLYREEMDLKLKKGLQTLESKLKEAGVNEVLDIRRKNVARRKWLPF